MAEYYAERGWDAATGNPLTNDRAAGLPPAAG